jgi:ABC-type Fe3+ transport system permease subunit
MGACVAVTARMLMLATVSLLLTAEPLNRAALERERDALDARRLPGVLYVPAGIALGVGALTALVGASCPSTFTPSSGDLRVPQCQTGTPLGLTMIVAGLTLAVIGALSVAMVWWLRRPEPRLTEVIDALDALPPERDEDRQPTPQQRRELEEEKERQLPGQSLIPSRLPPAPTLFSYAFSF